MPVLTMVPRDLEILDKDMKAADAVEYPSIVMDIQKDYAWKAVVTVDVTTAGTDGIAKLTLRHFSDVAGLNQIGADLDILTAINTKIDGNHEAIWGYGVNSLERGTLGAALDADTDAMQLASFMQVILEVTEQNNGTACTASVHLIRRHE